MNTRFVGALTLFILQLCCAGRYDKYSIYNFYVRNENDYKLLKSFNKPTYFKNIIFAETPLEKGIVQVLVHKDYEQEFRTKTEHFQTRTRMISSAAQQTFDEQLRPRNNESESFKSLDEVYSWLEHMTMKHNFTKLYSIGKSAEGREINVFSIKRPIRSNYFYSKAVIEAALHGNEWQSTYSTLYMIEQVLNAKKGQYAALKNKYFLYFIPVANPDGYVYSQDYDRLWIKNRRKTGADAYGVNLNRNFDYNFGEFDSSDDPHSQYYRGPHPFSEPETAHLRDFITKKGNQLAFYLSVHGHGQRFILPYSDSTKHVVNYHEVQVHARKAISYIVAEHTRRHFNYQPYKIGLASEIYGKRYSGDSASWVKKTFQAPFTCTVQVSDVGEMGIAVQNTNLPSIGKEMAQELTNFMMSTRHYRSYDEDSDDVLPLAMDGTYLAKADFVFCLSLCFCLFLMFLN